MTARVLVVCLLAQLLSAHLTLTAAKGGMPQSGRVRGSCASTQIAFEPNRGQASSGIRALIRGCGVTGWLDSTGGLTLSSGTGRTAGLRLLRPARRVRATLTGRLPGYVSYFIGRDPSAWRTHIPTFSSMTFYRVYPHIDLIWHSHGGRLEYDFQVHPGGRVDQIALSMNGIAEGAPRVYQLLGRDRVLVSVHVERSGAVVRFQASRYTHSETLTIDPTLLYSSRLGGSTFDTINSIAVDRAGAAYVTGTTDGVDFPLSHAMRNRRGGGTCAARPCTDAFVSKLNPQGTALVYSTYLGGNDADAGQRIAVDAHGAAYLAGITSSSDFPTASPLQPSIHGTACDLVLGIGQLCSDAFVAKLAPAGDKLLFSSYLGGSKTDWATGLGIDAKGEMVVTGTTESTDFPTASALQSKLAGRHDLFVSKISADGTHFVYSTYLGGSLEESSGGTAVDAKGNVYVGGTTQSPDYPQKHSLGLSFSGASDLVAAKLSPSGKLVYSTLLGVGNSYFPVAVAADRNHNAYLTTGVVPGSFTFTRTIKGSGAGPACLQPCEDIMVVKLGSGGDRRLYSVRIAGAHQDWAAAIAVDSAGDVYVGGSSRSNDFPLAHPIQSHRAGSSCQIEGGAPCADGVVLELTPTASSLRFSTYLGGEAEDNVLGLALGGRGNVFVCGYTQSPHFPRLHQLPGNHDEDSDGGFVTKLNPAIKGNAA